MKTSSLPAAVKDSSSSFVTQHTARFIVTTAVSLFQLLSFKLRYHTRTIISLSTETLCKISEVRIMLYCRITGVLISTETLCKISEVHIMLYCRITGVLISTETLCTISEVHIMLYSRITGVLISP